MIFSKHYINVWTEIIFVLKTQFKEEVRVDEALKVPVSSVLLLFFPPFTPDECF